MLKIVIYALNQNVDFLLGNQWGCLMKKSSAETYSPTLSLDGEKYT